MNVYLLFNNIHLRNLTSEAIKNNTIKGSNIKNTHLRLSVDDLYENSGLRFDSTGLTNLSSLNSYDINVFLDSTRIQSKDAALIFRFHQYDCEKCVLYALERALIFAEKENINLLVWGEFDGITELKAYKNRLNTSGKTIWYLVPRLPIPIEKHKQPYYMVLTKDGIAVDFFTPDKMDPMMTERYFQMIGSKWNRNNSLLY